MEWPKLKNIIIIMLACVNLFLLILVVHRQWTSKQFSEGAREDAIAVLWETGRIHLDQSILPHEMTLRPMAITRDPDLEHAQAAALLGELYATPTDSMRYEGDKGSAQFFVNGEFSAVFKPGAYPLEGAEPGAFAAELLAAMGYDAEILDRETDGGETAVTVRQRWAGAPVFDCTAVLVFREEELREIRRNVSFRLMGEPQPCKEGESLDLVTLLLQFMDYVNKNTVGCNEITGFTAGYALDTQSSDPIRLVPTWYVTTDQGAYYWNSLTGEIRPE